MSLPGAVRHTDPASSYEAAATCDAVNQRQRILDEMLSHASWTYTADDFHREHPEVQRNVWSSRLSQLERAGKIEHVGFSRRTGRKVKAFSLVR